MSDGDVRDGDAEGARRGDDGLESAEPDMPTEDDRLSDWGAWLRNRLEQTAHLEAAAGDPTGAGSPPTTVDEVPAPPLAPPTPDEAPDPTPAPPAAGDLGDIGDLGALGEDGPEPAGYAEVAPPGATGEPRGAEEPDAGRASPEALPSGVDPQVTRGLVALRAALDDTIDRLDGLTAAFLAQGTDLGEQLERETAFTTAKLDQAVATLTGQQLDLRGAIDHILDRTAETGAAVDRLAATVEAATAFAAEEGWRQPLQELAGQLAAGRTASAIQAAETAEVGSRLDRIQEALDRLAITVDGHPSDAVPAGPLEPPVVELDEEQTETIARAVAALLAGGTSPAAAPASRSAPSARPPRGPAPPTGGDSGPPGPSRQPSRPRRRAVPLRAASSRAADDPPGDVMPAPAWHPERS